jgi:hypothetical protein
VLHARARLQEKANLEESAGVAEFLEVFEMNQAITMRDLRGKKPEEIERKMGLKEGFGACERAGQGEEGGRYCLRDVKKRKNCLSGHWLGILKVWCAVLLTSSKSQTTAWLAFHPHTLDKHSWMGFTSTGRFIVTSSVSLLANDCSNKPRRLTGSDSLYHTCTYIMHQ